MARIIKIGLAALALSVGTLAVVAGTKGMEAAKPITVSAAIKSVELTAEQLRNVVLANHVFQERKTDKIFRIPLDNGAYIDGAILFNDCENQYTGSTLGDAFGLHNPGPDSGTYNFNVFFSFQNVTDISVSADICSDHTEDTEKTLMMAKFARIDGNFHDVLTTTEYSTLVSRAGSGVFYDASDYNTAIATLNAEHTSQSVSCERRDSNPNLAAFQFTYDDGNLIDNGNEITCTIKSLYFEYYCN